ncbi:MAG: DUF5011 domain-containing protein [Nitrospiraceae bacterium]|nr:DUF5011 domain-containing protein [Nitrospiraceae bacterium]
MKTKLASALVLLLAVASTAWAGTCYINFDGDDGSGSSLPAGVTFAATTFDGATATVDRAGGNILFPPAWVADAELTAEFTIQDLSGFLADAGDAGSWVFGFQLAGGGCCYPAAVITNDGLGITDHTVVFSECGVNSAGSADAPLAGSSLATLRFVADPVANEVRTYIAYDTDATIAAGRATNWTLVATYGWGSIHFGNWLFGVQSWGKVGVIDDIIITGANVPDFGTPPPLPDTTAPEITLLGDAVVAHPFGQPYVDAGATASDDVDGDITADIVVGGDAVDENTVGPYTITYNVSDAAGNPAPEVTRTVNVSEDSDEDGLSDPWELLYFGNLDQGPDDDPDNDGQTNAAEAANGTDPTDPESRLPVGGLLALGAAAALLTTLAAKRIRK